MTLQKLETNQKLKYWYDLITANRTSVYRSSATAGPSALAFFTA